MRAAWYERQGAARDVLVVGAMADPHPAAGEVRIRIAASAINPGDLKKRRDAFGYGMSFARVVPHSDGAGVVDEVGEGVPAARIGERVWCHGAQSYRPFGTAAELAVVPAAQALALPDALSFATGACLGIPGITAHRAVHAAGGVAGATLLVQGGAGAVGGFAVGLARRAGAHVVATARSERDAALARGAGAHAVVRSDTLSRAALVAAIRAHAPDGVAHIVEVAFDANIDVDAEVLAGGGSIAAYATAAPRPALPFWPLLFKNARIFLLGSDDFSPAHKAEAAAAIDALLREGWNAIEIARTFALDEIAEAHQHAETQRGAGRVVLTVAEAGPIG
ncbi:MAG: NADPH:quinone reductase [Rhizobacter sp.]|nr:NADPH:quinone reductase [Rhizobacter sp.]